MQGVDGSHGVGDGQAVTDDVGLDTCGSPGTGPVAHGDRADGDGRGIILTRHTHAPLVRQGSHHVCTRPAGGLHPYPFKAWPVCCC